MIRKIILSSVMLFLFTFSMKAQLRSVRIDADVAGICSGDSLELILNIDIEGYPNLRFEWTPSSGISSTTSDRPKVSPSVTTTYHVTVYDESYGGSLTDSFEVNVVPVPEVIAPSNDSLCVNKTYLLTPQKFFNAKDLLWTIQSGKGKFSDSQGATSQEQSALFVPDSGFIGKVTIELRGSGSDYCDDVVDYVNLFYLDGGIQTSILTDSAVLCTNDSLAINAQAANYNYYFWTHNGKGILQDGHTLHPVYIPDPREFGELKLTLSATGEFCNVKDSVSFLLSEMYLKPIEDFEACNGELLSIGYANDKDINFTWNTGSDESTIKVQALADDEFMLYAENTEGCNFFDTIRMTVYQVPTITVEYDFGDKIITVDPDNLPRYVFKTDRQSTVLQDSETHFYYYEEILGTYDSIYIEAYNDHCPAYERFAIPNFKKVNVFTPNGDNINDRLMPGRRITVFNRSNKIMYEGWDGWDGTFKGNKMPQGTYFYILYTNEGDIFYKGPVTLLRD